MIRILLVMAFLLTVPAGSLSAASAMDDLRWKHRPLLLFAPAADALAAQGLRADLERAEAGFRDRHMVLIEVYGDETADLDGKALPPATAAELRRRYAVSSDEVTVILIGKDGGEKLRTSGDAELDRIFGLIDTMPMRRREMQE